MNRFTKWFLRNLCKELVSRGYHKYFIASYFKIMTDAARARFTEDNKATFESYMQECLEEAMNPKQF